MNNQTTWQRFAPLGLITIGFGLSLLGNTMERKAAGQPWFWRGTVSLSVINAGIALFGEAVKARTLHEWQQKEAHNATNHNV